MNKITQTDMEVALDWLYGNLSHADACQIFKKASTTTYIRIARALKEANVSGKLRFYDNSGGGGSGGGISPQPVIRHYLGNGKALLNLYSPKKEI
jgi:hypothetical protein